MNFQHKVVLRDDEETEHGEIERNAEYEFHIRIDAAARFAPEKVRDLFHSVVRDGAKVATVTLDGEVRWVVLTYNEDKCDTYRDHTPCPASWFIWNTWDANGDDIPYPDIECIFPADVIKDYATKWAEQKTGYINTNW